MDHISPEGLEALRYYSMFAATIYRETYDAAMAKQIPDHQAQQLALTMVTFILGPEEKKSDPHKELAALMASMSPGGSA